jgi:uncharacterized protein
VPVLEFPQFSAAAPFSVLLMKRPDVLKELVATNGLSENALVKRFTVFSRASIDTFFHDANAFVSANVDCMECANCCKTLQPDVDENEIKTLGAQFPNGALAFEHHHVKVCSDGSKHLSSNPCVFLHDNKCSVYTSKPSSCSRFPHLEEPNVKFRLRRIIALRTVCPIVYNVIAAAAEAVANDVTV